MTDDTNIETDRTDDRNGLRAAVTAVRRAADWTAASRYRTAGTIGVTAAVLTSVAAVAIRYSWQLGIDEPANGLHVAVIDVLASLPLAGGAAVVALLVYGWARRYHRDGWPDLRRLVPSLPRPSPPDLDEEVRDDAD